MAHTSIYTVGGTVQAGGGGVYIPRKADQKLLDLCRRGVFSYVLSPRQMGKSSLMVQTAEQLRKEGVRTAIIDLQPIGAQASPEEWYLGLLTEIEDQLDLSEDLLDWWENHAHLGFVQRMTRFFNDVVLSEISEPIVVFVDEIDTTLGLTFTDDFFIAIRYFYSARAQNPDFERLSFVLIGVATPGDLISDPQRTPFNVGQRVDLSDFTLEEAKPLSAGLKFPAIDSKQVLAWVLDWTGGHPYLTQRLCQELVSTANVESQRKQRPNDFTKAKLDDVVAATFFGTMSDQDNNLQFVRDMLVRRAPDLYQVLTTYKDIWRERKPVEDEEQSLIKSHLKLSGVVKRDNRKRLVVRNAVYKSIFNEKWIRENLPVNWRRKVKELQGTVTVLSLIVMLGVALFSYQQLRKSFFQVATQLDKDGIDIGEIDGFPVHMKDALDSDAEEEILRALAETDKKNSISLESTADSSDNSSSSELQNPAERLEDGLSLEETGDGLKAEESFRVAFNKAKKTVEKLSRKRKPIPPDHLETLNKTAVYYAWGRINYGDDKEAESVLDLAKSFSDDFEGRETDGLILSFALLDNAFSRLFLEQGKDAEALEQQHLAVSHARHAVALNEDDVEFKRTLATYLRNLSLTSESLMSKEESAKYAEEGCKIAKEAAQLPQAGDKLFNAMVTCAIDDSFEQLPNVATRTLFALKNQLSTAISENSGNIFHKINRSRLHSRLMDIVANEQANRDEADQYFEMALSDWRDAVSGSNTFSSSSAESLRKIYIDLKTYIEEGEDESKKESAFSEMSAAISRVDSEDSPKIALIAADSALRLGKLQAESNPSQAIRTLNQSIESFARTKLIDDISTYDERYSWICEAYSSRLALYAKQGDERPTIEDLRALESKCEPIFEKYNFDFYLHSTIRTAYNRAGKLLFEKEKFSEARPILEYASKWGMKDSTELLAQMYREGLSVANSTSKASELTSLAEKQSMKRFTVPADFGSGGEHPFYVYVYQKPEDYQYKGIDDQIKWLKEARGGTIADDVAESFRKLEAIAFENNVSFPDLAVYALANANKDNSDEEASSNEE